MSIQSLKGLNMDRVLEIDEAIALSAEARALTNEFEQHELPVPGWLQTASDTINGEIAKRTHASDLAMLRNLEAEMEGYKTVTEKRTEAHKRLAALQKKLGLSTAARA